jgi:hypothetical protein
MDMLHKINHPTIIPKLIINFENLYKKEKDKNKWFSIYASIFLKNSRKVCDLIHFYIKTKSKSILEEIKKFSKKLKLNEEEIFINVKQINSSIEKNVIKKFAKP